MNVDLHRARGARRALVALAGCATLPDTPAKEAVAAVAAATPFAAGHRQRAAAGRRAGQHAAADPPPPASSLRTFAEVSRDAKELPGPVPPLAEGRQGLDRDRARSVRPARISSRPTSTRVWARAASSRAR